MCVVAQNEINRLYDMKLLDLLLADKTSKGNIIWATDVYGGFGKDYQRDKEITSELLVREPFRLMSRAERPGTHRQSAQRLMPRCSRRCGS